MFLATRARFTVEYKENIYPHDTFLSLLQYATYQGGLGACPPRKILKSTYAGSVMDLRAFLLINPHKF